jgi:hypothetical protein
MLSSTAESSPSRPLAQTRPLWRTCAGRAPSVSAKTGQRLCDLTAIATAAVFAVPVGEIAAATRRSSDIALARQSAMYLSHVAFGLSLSEVGRGFGRDRTTAAHACRLVEERRDDPTFDAVLGGLEVVCLRLRRRLEMAVRP